MRTADRDLTAWLHSMDSLQGGEIPKGYTYASMEDYVLDRGTLDAPRALSREQKLFLRWETRACDHRLRECFYNAQTLALHPSGRFTYREGYAMGRFPCLHGWCLLDGTHLVDLTWRTNVLTRRARRIRGVFPETWAYYGVSYTNEEIRARLYRHAAWCSFLDDFADGWPLLKLPRLAPRTHDGALVSALKTRVAEMSA